MSIPFHFILISFFAFSALFASSVSSFLVFIGAILGLIFPIIIEGIVENMDAVKSINETDLIKCYGMPVFGTIRKTPLSIFIYTYLLFYFIYVFTKNSLWNSMNSAIMFMGLLGILVADIYRTYNACGIPVILIASSFATGILWGALWPVVIGKNNQYKPGVSSSEKCGLNGDKTKYQCKLQTDGTLIG